jgi:hypothetical protein
MTKGDIAADVADTKRLERRQLGRDVLIGIEDRGECAPLGSPKQRLG